MPQVRAKALWKTLQKTFITEGEVKPNPNEDDGILAVHSISIPVFTPNVTVPIPADDIHSIMNAEIKAGSKKVFTNTFLNRYLSESSSRLITECFWYVLLYHFRADAPGAEAYTGILFDLMSTHYTETMHGAKSRDNEPVNAGLYDVLRHYPDVVSQTLYSCFYTCFPSSRKQFDDHFKRLLVMDVVYWFTGMVVKDPEVGHWHQQKDFHRLTNNLVKEREALQRRIDAFFATPKDASGPVTEESGSGGAGSKPRRTVHLRQGPASSLKLEDIRKDLPFLGMESASLETPFGKHPRPGSSALSGGGASLRAHPQAQQLNPQGSSSSAHPEPEEPAEGKKKAPEEEDDESFLAKSRIYGWVTSPVFEPPVVGVGSSRDGTPEDGNGPGAETGTESAGEQGHISVRRWKTRGEYQKQFELQRISPLIQNFLALVTAFHEHLLQEQAQHRLAESQKLSAEMRESPQFTPPGGPSPAPVADPLAPMDFSLSSALPWGGVARRKNRAHRPRNLDPDSGPEGVHPGAAIASYRSAGGGATPSPRASPRTSPRTSPRSSPRGRASPRNSRRRMVRVNPNRAHPLDYGSLLPRGEQLRKFLGFLADRAAVLEPLTGSTFPRTSRTSSPQVLTEERTSTPTPAAPSRAAST
eukprot:RCo020371